MATPILLPPTTAGIFPQQFSEDLIFARDRTTVALVLGILLIVGLALRVNNLGAESLSEDELNKLETVQEYRAQGLSGKNGEHPFLMKGLQTLSVTASEKVNSFVSSATPYISEEAALRFPLALFGTFTALLIYLLISELFGRSIAVIAAGLWSLEPSAIAFDRIAKEDALVIFFFVLCLLLWAKSQTAAEGGSGPWFFYALGSAAAFGGLMASKYYPHLLAVLGGYYNIFKYDPDKKWNMLRFRWLIFAGVMGLAFLALNPTIMIPDTWREMLKYSTESRIGHDSYEYLGGLYKNQMSAWLTGVPWTFYYVFIAVKTSLLTLIFFLIGLPLMFRRRLGDGRYLLLFWAFMWFMPFTFLGGKFTRYFAVAEPLVLITAAVGLYFSLLWISKKLALFPGLVKMVPAFLLVGFFSVPLWNSLSVTPHFRLFTNEIGGGMSQAGTFFPHDEFYDAATREVIAKLAKEARPGALVVCETPGLFKHYAEREGRPDIEFISLSDPSKVKDLRSGDLIVLVNGRRYLSNVDLADSLKRIADPTATVTLLNVTAAEIYKLDGPALDAVRNTAKSR